MSIFQAKAGSVRAFGRVAAARVLTDSELDMVGGGDCNTTCCGYKDGYGCGEIKVDDTTSPTEASISG